jgi:hypothetical protein
MPRRSMITYPTERLLGVLDDPARAEAAAVALRATGVAPGDVDVLLGPEGRERLGRLGARRNVLSRIVRVFQYLSMDQLPDFLMYEAAIEEGRAVVAVRVANRDRMLRDRDVLVAHGGHFLNHFGRWWTEELTLWEGPEPEIPEALRR